MSKKILSRASLVGGAVCTLVVCALVGCSRDSSSEQSPSTSLSTQKADAQHKANLRTQMSDRDVLNDVRQTIVAKMETLVATKYKGDMKAAANDPEMISLIRRARDVETNFASNRAHTAEMIRANAQRKAAESKKNALKKEVK